jgi:hypothetical protein
MLTDTVHQIPAVPFQPLRRFIHLLPFCRPFPTVRACERIRLFYASILAALFGSNRDRTEFKSRSNYFSLLAPLCHPFSRRTDTQTRILLARNSRILTFPFIAIPSCHPFRWRELVKRMKVMIVTDSLHYYACWNAFRAADRWLSTYTPFLDLGRPIHPLKTNSSSDCTNLMCSDIVSIFVLQL